MTAIPARGGRSRRRSGRPLIAVALLVVTLVAAGCAAAGPGRGPPGSPLPLRPTGQVPLPGDGSRFDYASIDPTTGRLYLAHLGASALIEVDLHTHQVVRTIANLPEVHGVLAVPALGRVYATATGADQIVALDQNTGQVLTRSPTGDYPAGLAYDPLRTAIWATNQTGGTETVIDGVTGTVRGTVDLGAQVGNVAYDSSSDRMLVAVQGRNELAAIDPTTFAVTSWVALPGCDHSHGLAADPDADLAFVACDANAALLTVDLDSQQVTAVNPVGSEPDVLAYDQGAHRLYVAAESGWVSVLDLHGRTLSVRGSDHLARGAHVVAVDPATHNSYYPIPTGADGAPALLEESPVP